MHRKRLSTRALARASASHPWRTLAAWGVAAVLAIFAVATLLGGSLSSENLPTDNRQSERADQLIDGSPRGLALRGRPRRRSRHSLSPGSASAAGGRGDRRALGALHGRLIPVPPRGRRSRRRSAADRRRCERDPVHRLARSPRDARAG